MKLSKTKSVFLAFLAALVLAALCFGAFAVNGKAAYADSNNVSLNGYEGKNFVYSADITPADGAQSAWIVFGADGDTASYFAGVADIANNKIILQTEKEELKTAGYTFDGAFKITVVVNEDIVKIYIGNGNVADLVCRLENYAGGKLGYKLDGEFNISNVGFIDTDAPEADIYCNGYSVLKVVNVTDGNYKLKSGEYTEVGGNLTVSPEYIKTLESNTEYVFRVVTSFTDFDFKIKTDFTAVTATPAVDKYYRNDEVTLELSGNIKVHKLLIDGKECSFTQSEDIVKISTEDTGDLSTGSHSVKLYTDKGRPETTINVSELVETVSEPVVKATHVFLWIDVAIFASAIIGYAAFSIYGKYKKK